MADCELITSKKYAPAHLGRVLVLGLGKSGHDAANYLIQQLGGRVEALAIFGGSHGAAADDFAREATGAGAHVAFGEDAVPQLAAAVGGHFELCIASPGISEFSELYQAAAAVSDEAISEVEFAWRESAASSRWVAITGTNGKTTTTALTEHLLKAAGVRAAAVGNIGDTCISAVAANAADVYVAEVSSYQLASTKRFAPNVAVMLNITPDHLHWHHTLENYRDAKFKLLDNLPSVSGAVAVMDATNDVVRAKVRKLRQQEGGCGFSCIPMGTSEGLAGDMRTRCGSENAAFLAQGEMLTVAINGKEHTLVKAEDLLIKGAHNAGNALAAAAAALAIGADEAAVCEALVTFAPLEHRIEPCGTVRGAACYNDSKATNVDATLKALAAFPHTRPIVLLGGDDKGTDLADLVSAAHAHTRACVCFGAAGQRFAEAFEAASASAPADFKLLRADHMEDALDVALSEAKPGEVVLLSPACASFDEFHSFEERGDVFKKLVSERAAKLGA